MRPVLRTLSSLGAAALTVEVDLPDRPREINLSGPAVAAWNEGDRAIGRLPPDGLEGVASGLQGDLEKFRRAIGGALYVGDWSRVGSALDALITAGRVFWRAVLGVNPSRTLLRLQESLEPFLQRPPETDDPYADTLRYVRSAPTIEVRGRHAALLPLDLLPLGNRSRRAISRTAGEVMDDARLLPAFSAVTRYLDYRNVPSPPADKMRALIRTARPTQGLAFFRSTRAPMWEEALAGLRKARASPVSTPLPTINCLDNPGHVAYFFLDPWPLDGQSVVSDIYVHAHGYMGTTLNTTLEVEFVYPLRRRLVRRSRRFMVSSGDFERAAEIMGANPKSSDGAVLFLNCCYGGGLLGTILLATGITLVSMGVAGVIAPRDKVPGGAASAFAAWYYNFRNDLPTPGEAVLAARVLLLRNFGNPLGCLYFGFGGIT